MVAPKYPWHISSRDGVGRQTSIITRSVFLWVRLSVIVSRCTYYQSGSFKHRFRRLVTKKLIMSLRLWIIRQKLIKLCTVKTVCKVSKLNKNKSFVERHAMACKGRHMAKLWLRVNSSNIHSSTLGYLFMCTPILVMCTPILDLQLNLTGDTHRRSP